MKELKDLMRTQRNYYALLISILTTKTAKDSLMNMGICPDSEMSEGGNNNNETV